MAGCWNGAATRWTMPCPHAIFACAGEERWCAIAVLSDAQWKTLCRLMGDPEWCRDAAYETLDGRKRAEAEIEQRIGQWTRSREAQEIESLLLAAGIPAAVVQSTADLIERDPQLAARGFFRRMTHAVIGEHINRGPAFRFSRSEDCQFVGPALGEHNDYVFRELLGMGEEEVAAATREGGISTAAELPPMKGTF